MFNVSFKRTRQKSVYALWCNSLILFWEPLEDVHKIAKSVHFHSSLFNSIKNMQVIFCLAILLVNISVVYCVRSLNGTCGNTAFHYCDWAGWGKWSQCSNQCGTGSQEKRRFVCCPPEYNASTILQCIVNLCSHKLSDYINQRNCSSFSGCKGRPWFFF